MNERFTWIDLLMGELYDELDAIYEGLADREDAETTRHINVLSKKLADLKKSLKIDDEGI